MVAWEIKESFIQKSETLPTTLEKSSRKHYTYVFHWKMSWCGVLRWHCESSNAYNCVHEQLLWFLFRAMTTSTTTASWPSSTYTWDTTTYVPETMDRYVQVLLATVGLGSLQVRLKKCKVLLFAIAWVQKPTSRSVFDRKRIVELGVWFQQTFDQFLESNKLYEWVSTLKMNLTRCSFKYKNANKKLNQLFTNILFNCFQTSNFIISYIPRKQRTNQQNLSKSAQPKWIFLNQHSLNSFVASN